MNNYLENSTKYAAVVGIASVALAVSHELGYFFIVGFGFLSAFSIDDLLTNSLKWVPFTIILWLLGALLARMRINNNWQNDPFIEKMNLFGTKPKTMRKIIIVYVLVIFIFPYSWFLLYIGLMFWTYPIINGYLIHNKIINQENSEWSIELFFFTFLLAQNFLYGCQTGYIDVRAKEGSYDIVLIDRTIFSATLMKINSSNILIGTKGGEVKLISRNRLIEINRKSFYYNHLRSPVFSFLYKTLMSAKARLFPLPAVGGAASPPPNLPAPADPLTIKN